MLQYAVCLCKETTFSYANPLFIPVNSHNFLLIPMENGLLYIHLKAHTFNIQDNQKTG